MKKKSNDIQIFAKHWFIFLSNGRTEKKTTTKTKYKFMYAMTGEKRRDYLFLVFGQEFVKGDYNNRLVTAIK